MTFVLDSRAFSQGNPEVADFVSFGPDHKSRLLILIMSSMQHTQRMAVVNSNRTFRAGLYNEHTFKHDQNYGYAFWC